MNQQPKRLYKSSRDRKLFGVCGGIAEYFNIDPVLVRVGWAVATLLTIGTGILAYIVTALIIPDQPNFIEGQWEEKD